MVPARWPPMTGSGCLTSCSSSRAYLSTGHTPRPPLGVGRTFQRMPCWLELTHAAKRRAASGYLLCFVTAYVEPPQLPVANVWVDHCGIGAARHPAPRPPPVLT